MEELIVTGRQNAQVDPVLAVWHWEVPVYLFLGGLAAGLLILGAIDLLRGSNRPSAVRRLQLAVPVLLALGMLALFLDLEHKLNVWRFYTTIQITAPMSWGSWILLMVVPVSMLLIAGTVREGFALRSWPAPAVLNWAERRRVPAAWLALGLGVALGIYTGILLSAYVARPFWNSSILGPLFLVSGLSSAAALVQLAGGDVAERHRYARVDAGLIAIELLLLALMMFAMATGPSPYRSAAALVMGGPLTTFFWIFVVALGLVLPLVLEAMHLRGRPVPHFLAPVLVLAGGLIFRFFMVEAGQLSTWTSY
jgi:protein NrfD